MTVLEILLPLAPWIAVLQIVPAIVTFYHYIQTRVIDFLIGTLIFTIQSISFVTTSNLDDTRGPYIPIFQNDVVTFIRFIDVLQVLLYVAFAVNALLTRWDINKTNVDKILFVGVVAFVIGILGYIFLTPFDAPQPYWSATYRYIQLFRVYTGMIMFYYYWTLDYPVKTNTIKFVRSAYLFVAITFIPSGIVEILWSLNRANDTPNDLVNFLGFEVFVPIGIFTGALILFILLAFPQFFVISKTQLIRARNLFDRVKQNKKAVTSRQLQLYISSIPQEIYGD